jgi:hypothetical protein
MTGQTCPGFIRLKTLPLLLTLAGFALGTPALAQPAPVQQLQNSQITQQTPQFRELYTATNAPELYKGENIDVGPQRILRLIPRPLYFNILLDSQVFYSDNANFASSPDRIGSTVFVNTAQAAFTPPDVNFDNAKLSSILGIASQWYNYENAQMSSLSFDAQTAFLGAKYAFGKWSLAFDFSYTRLVTQPTYKQTYQEVLPALTLQRFFPINSTMLVVVGNQVDYHFTDESDATFGSSFGTPTGVNNRFDDIVSLSFTWQITPNLIVQPAYRFMYSNYRYINSNVQDASGRNDYLNYVGVSLAYYFNKNFSVRTFFNFSDKSTDDSNTSEYHEYNGGAGASLNLAF